MQNGQAGQTLQEALERLRGKGDLGRQQDRLPAGLDYLAYRLYVDFRLPASCYSVQQRCGEFSPRQFRAQRPQNLFLVGVQFKRVVLDPPGKVTRLGTFQS